MFSQFPSLIKQGYNYYLWPVPVYEVLRPVSLQHRSRLVCSKVDEVPHHGQLRGLGQRVYLVHGFLKVGPRRHEMQRSQAVGHARCVDGSVVTSASGQQGRNDVRILGELRRVVNGQPVLSRDRERVRKVCAEEFDCSRVAAGVHGDDVTGQLALGVFELIAAVHAAAVVASLISKKYMNQD